MKEPVIAFQGAAGAFSHEAAMQLGEAMSFSFDVLPCHTFDDVFAHVQRGGRNFGVIPLENSSIGSIAANYDLLWSESVYVVAECYVPIHHQLIGLPEAETSGITEVFSHPAALDQCRNLFKTYPHMQARVHWDTSGAVSHVKEQGDLRLAAIAGELAAREAGLKIVLQDIEDQPSNTTRFGLITADERSLSPPAGLYKLSCAFELSHKPGSLVCILDKIAAAGANLTRIESRPIPEQPWHYRFFVDIELSGPAQEESIAAVWQSAHKFKVIGRYTSALTALSN